MELLDIVDENGEPTGEVRDREEIHSKGLLHRTSHLWIVRDNDKGGLDVLLQKRSDNKDSNPGCYDISSAGHIKAGDGYLNSAIRELREELGMEASQEELVQCYVRRVRYEAIFHGKEFRDNQVTRVYRMKRNDINIENLTLQKEEVSSVIWMDLEECIKAVRDNTFKNCICLEEIKKILF